MAQLLTDPQLSDGLISIQDVRAGDYDQWLALWHANNNGAVNDEVTTETWNRLISAIFPVHGLVARLPDGKLAGFVHFVLHPVTGHIQPACYMQDLYIDPPHRRRGIGRALVMHLANTARHEKWARLYWLAHGQNAEAQALYKALGLKLDFTFHVMPLN